MYIKLIIKKKNGINYVVVFVTFKGVTVLCNLDMAACTIRCKTSSSQVTSYKNIQIFSKINSKEH